MTQKLRKATPVFKLFVLNQGLGMKQPILRIEWLSSEGMIVGKKSILLQDGQILYDFVEDMITYNIFAYNEFLTFAQKVIQPRYISVYRIITDKRLLQC